MSLLEVRLNQYVFLDNYQFQSDLNNINFLNRQAIESSTLNQQLDLLNKATSKVEKFHSFFHFEQSYFHLQFAIELQKINKLEEARQQFELAIFQDHNNQQAISILNNSSSYQNYKRPFESYAQFLNFASEEKIKESYQNPHWENFQLSDLEKIIEDLRFRHLNYHQQSARLYLNRAIVFRKLNLLDLAYNDLKKANNLDSDLLKRDDFIKIIPELASKVIIGLGSNLGDREFFLKESIKRLGEERILYQVISSEIEETKALLKDGSPLEWNKNFLNQVLIGYTFLSPYKLLRKIKNLESAIGRSSHITWSPREIDIDIIDFEGMKISEKDLTIPHPEIFNRDWIVKALTKMDPEWINSLRVE